jgi:hypothetical protein
MDKETLIKHIESGLSTYKIAKLVNTSNSTIRYWLRKYELKTKRSENKDVEVTEKTCPMCSKTKPLDEFYDRRNKVGNSPYCKPCTKIQTIERQRKLKQDAINYKGGCCQKCGYNKYNGALEFHHIDPTQKDFTIAHLKLTTFNETIKKELDKCILVCANCHREIHGGL